MTKRTSIMVLILACVTFGIYPIIWFVKTKDEMNTRGANIPSAWHLIIPILNLLWFWKWCQGVEKVTNGKQSAVMALLLMWIVAPLGMFLVQNAFNDVADAAPGALRTA